MMTIIFIGLIILGAVAIILKIKIQKKRNKRVYIPIIEPKTTLLPEDEDHPNIEITEKVSLYDEFINTYDSGNLKFNNTGFRKGAQNTCSFGISEGFKRKNGKMVWGYVRLHTGVDRSNGGEIKQIKDIVQIPFDFNRSKLYVYKKNNKYYGYGTLIILFNDKYGFEMRIAHMDPDKDILPWALNRLKNCQGFKAGWLLGSAGTCGDSTGPHTHTEFISLKETCPVFDEILENKFGKKALTEYSKTEVLKEYRKHKHFINATDEEILKDWINVKAYRGAYFVNKYKYKYIVNGVKRTRYASNLLFNGL
jgi:hypothetical protein